MPCVASVTVSVRPEPPEIKSPKLPKPAPHKFKNNKQQLGHFAFQFLQLRLVEDAPSSELQVPAGQKLQSKIEEAAVLVGNVQS